MKLTKIRMHVRYKVNIYRNNNITIHFVFDLRNIIT